MRSEKAPKQTESPSFIERFITPEMIILAQEGSEHTPEYLILDRLIGVLVESGPELDFLIKKQLRNLVGIIRILAFQNMSQEEQVFEIEWAQSVNASSFQYEITPEVEQELKRIWQRFNLTNPLERNSTEELPEGVRDLLKEL